MSYDVLPTSGVVGGEVTVAQDTGQQKTTAEFSSHQTVVGGDRTAPGPTIDRALFGNDDDVLTRPMALPSAGIASTTINSLGHFY
jgi:hypothetical protein